MREKYFKNIARAETNPKESRESKLIVRRTRLVGPVNSASVEKVMKDIDTANEQDDVGAIRMTIASGGGSISDARALYDHILDSEKPIDIVAAGYCMSAAVTILQAGRKRLSYPHTSFMIHQSSLAISSQPYDEVMETVKQYKKNHYQFLDLTRERSGMSKEEMESIYKPKKYLTAKEALEIGPHGLIDEIIVFKR